MISDALALKRFRKWWAGINATITEAMIAVGWHQHRREWRKKRGTNVNTLATAATLPGTWIGSELTDAAGSMDPTLSNRAANRNKTALPAVQDFLQDNPAAVALWGDVGRRMLKKLLRLHAAKDLLTQQAIVRFASDLRSRLAGQNPSAFEVLVAERVVIAWTFANWAETIYVINLEGAKYDLRSEQLALKRIEMANRNLLAACRTLAKVKRANLSDVLALVKAVAPPVIQ